MGLYKRADSPFWWYSITVHGRRLRGCCRTTTRDDALNVMAEARIANRSAAARGRSSDITLNDAFVRYWREHAERLPSYDDIGRIGEALIRALGVETLLADVTPDMVARYVATRRARLADASVNRELTMLRAVMRMAALRWGKRVAEIDWKRQWLLEPAPRDRILSADEEARLFAALRPDLHGLVRFALATGMRFDNIRTLRWRQVDWEARVIRLRVKSRRPGGEVHAVPLTAGIAAILSAERGRHAESVFTFVEHDRHQRIIGERRPFTQSGWRRPWTRALAEAGIDDFRFHDLRHTTATRLLRATGNLRLVQQLLGHRSIETTLRYARSEIDDVRAGLERLEAGTIGPRREAR